VTERLRFWTRAERAPRSPEPVGETGVHVAHDQRGGLVLGGLCQGRGVGLDPFEVTLRDYCGLAVCGAGPLVLIVTPIPELAVRRPVPRGPCGERETRLVGRPEAADLPEEGGSGPLQDPRIEPLPAAPGVSGPPG
jgi:hypothetical protein